MRQQFGDLNVFLVVVVVGGGGGGSTGSYTIRWTVIKPYQNCLTKMFLLAKHA